MAAPSNLHSLPLLFFHLATLCIAVFLFRFRSQKAQSAVEFALTAPVLILLFFGLLDLGRAYYYSIQLQDAARSGVRVTAGLYSAQGPTDSEICNFIKADLTKEGPVTCVFVSHQLPFVAGTDYTLPAANSVVAVIYPPFTTSPCNSSTPCRSFSGASLHVPIAVAVYYRFQAVTPFVNNIIPSGMVMSAQAEQVSDW